MAGLTTAVHTCRVWAKVAPHIVVGESEGLSEFRVYLFRARAQGGADHVDFSCHIEILWAACKVQKSLHAYLPTVYSLKGTH